VVRFRDGPEPPSSTGGCKCTGAVYNRTRPGMKKGAPQDEGAATALGKAKAIFSEESGNTLPGRYMDAFEKIIATPIDKTSLSYPVQWFYVLIRVCCKVRGAYGFPGLVV